MKERSKVEKNEKKNENFLAPTCQRHTKKRSNTHRIDQQMSQKSVLRVAKASIVCHQKSFHIPRKFHIPSRSRARAKLSNVIKVKIKFVVDMKKKLLSHNLFWLICHYVYFLFLFFASLFCLPSAHILSPMREAIHPLPQHETQTSFFLLQSREFLLYFCDDFCFIFEIISGLLCSNICFILRIFLWQFLLYFATILWQCWRWSMMERKERNI